MVGVAVGKKKVRGEILNTRNETQFTQSRWTGLYYKLREDLRCEGAFGIKSQETRIRTSEG